MTYALRLGIDLEAISWALRLGFEGGTKEKKEEKIPHMCESIGHRFLRGRCLGPPSSSTTIYLSRARVPLTI